MTVIVIVRKSYELIQSATFAIIILKYGHEKENEEKEEEIQTHTKVKWNNQKPVMNELVRCVADSNTTV